jgi:hypothetical protein
MMRILNNGRGGLVALLASTALVLTGCSLDPSVELTDEMKTLLTVTDSSSSCTKIVGEDAVIDGVYKLNVEALTQASKRYVTTSPGLPLEGKSAKARHADIELTLCTDPLQGGMFAHYLAHAKVADTSILSLNEWLQPFNVDVNQVSVKVQELYLPNFGKDNPTDDEYQAQATATRAYVEFASKLVTMLNRFQQYDEAKAKSRLNYSLAAGGAVVGIVPPLQLNPEQESLQAKRYALTEKDQCKPLLIFGFNVHDKRVEEFSPPDKCKTNPKPTATPTPKSICKKNCGSTPPPTCKKNCGNDAKKAKDDPAAKGNAGNGSGKNENPGKGATTTPTAIPSTPRSNPPAPEPPASSRPAPPPKEDPKPSDPPETGDPGGF